MDTKKVSKDLSCNLFGKSIPINAIYGKVGSLYYICQNFTAQDGFYAFFVYNPQTKAWIAKMCSVRKYKAIYEIIAEHVKNPANDLKVGKITHKVRDKKKAFYAQKRREAQKVRQFQEERLAFRKYVESTCGQKMNNNSFIMKGRPQELPNVESATNVECSEIGYIGYDVLNPKAPMPSHFDGIERGNRDHMSVKFVKVARGTEKPEYMKYTGKYKATNKRVLLGAE